MNITGDMAKIIKLVFNRNPGNSTLFKQSIYFSL